MSPLGFDSKTITLSGGDAQFTHMLGHAEGATWIAEKRDGPGIMAYGPRKIRMRPGTATVEFGLQIDENRSDNEIVARADILDADTPQVVAHRIIRRGDFGDLGHAQSFDIKLEVSTPKTSLKFRVYSFGTSRLQLHSITIFPELLNLTALWNHEAHFEYQHRHQFSSGNFNDGLSSPIIALDGLWYAFNRMPVTAAPQDQASACVKAGHPLLQVVVRTSADHGTNWTDPTVIVAPSWSSQAADYCEVTDGDAFFDEETDTWHYLGQCINTTGHWDMCHYTRGGSVPIGRFVADRENPVVRGGELWGRICKGVEKACPESMQDEGTPQIIKKSEEGYFYVTFHGANYGNPVTGARGIARTRDFEHWEVTGDDLPSDALLSSRDCNDWHVDWGPGGCIGEGNARMLLSGGYYYMLAEAADRNLICQPGQTWVFGLVRSRLLTPSGSWQNFDSNPLVANERASPVGCALQYMNIIHDRAEIFLEFSAYVPDGDFPSYFFHLIEGRGSSDSVRIR